MFGVSTEQLVRGLSAQSNGHRFAGKTTQQKKAEEREICDRFLEVPKRLVEEPPMLSGTRK